MSLCIFIYRYFKGTYHFKVQQVYLLVRPDFVSTAANGNHSISFKEFPCCLITLQKPASKYYPASMVHFEMGCDEMHICSDSQNPYCGVGDKQAPKMLRFIQHSVSES